MVKICMNDNSFQQEGISFSKVENGVKLEIASDVCNTIIIEVGNEGYKSFDVLINDGANIELIEVFKDGINCDALNFTCECYGYLKHSRVLLNKSSKSSIKNEVTVKNGEYVLSYVDLLKGSLKVENTIKLEGPYTFGSINCAAISGETNIKKYTNSVVNLSYHTKAYMENYGVSFEKGNLHIIGIGDIKKGGSNSATHQKSTMFVLDEGSKSTSEPYLYIDEDDVEASHASAVGKIDDETLFYLCSRGISKEGAKKMVVLGYFQPIFDKIGDTEIRELINKHVQEVIGHV